MLSIDDVQQRGAMTRLNDDISACLDALDPSRVKSFEKIKSGFAKLRLKASDNSEFCRQMRAHGALDQLYEWYGGASASEECKSDLLWLIVQVGQEGRIAFVDYLFDTAFSLFTCTYAYDIELLKTCKPFSNCQDEYEMAVYLIKKGCEGGRKTAVKEGLSKTVKCLTRDDITSLELLDQAINLGVDEAVDTACQHAFNMTVKSENRFSILKLLVSVTGMENVWKSVPRHCIDKLLSIMTESSPEEQVFIFSVLINCTDRFTGSEDIAKYIFCEYAQRIVELESEYQTPFSALLLAIVYADNQKIQLHDDEQQHERIDQALREFAKVPPLTEKIHSLIFRLNDQRK